MDSKPDVVKTKAKIAKLREIADSLPPGQMKQALGKKADELGKRICHTSRTKSRRSGS
jgi:hypothetical protein